MTMSRRTDDESPLDERWCDDDIDDRRPAARWQAWLEIAMLAALATAARLIADLGLPWLALAPLLAGMRYGSTRGVACAAAQLTALIIAAHGAAHGATPSHLALDPPGGQAILGWLIAGLVPGQFRDAWARRLRRLETRARDASQRLEALARAYHVVVASHDQLQREIPGSPSSLRDALEALAREVAESPEPRSLASLGGRILTLFRAHAAVRAATLHAVDAEGRVASAAAILGSPAARDDDPLIREAVRVGEVVSVRDLPAPAAALVAVPLVDITGRVHAVVAVHDLPFLVLHHDTLALFAVLGGRLGDVLAGALEASRAIADAPTRAFCATVSRSRLDARRYGIPAALVIVEVAGAPGEHPPRLLACCLAAHRRITDDAEIIAGTDGTLRVVVLLRLTGAAGLQRYLARLDGLAHARADELGARCDIRLRGWSLDEAPLPRHPRALELGLAALLDADPLETPVSRGRHDLVA